MANFYKYEKEAGDSQYLTILEEKTTRAKLLLCKPFVTKCHSLPHPTREEVNSQLSGMKPN